MLSHSPQYMTCTEYIIKPAKQLTPLRTGLPEKLTLPQLLKKFPSFYETKIFITAFTTAGHLSLS